MWWVQCFTFEGQENKDNVRLCRIRAWDRPSPKAIWQRYSYLYLTCFYSRQHFFLFVEYLPLLSRGLGAALSFGSAQSEFLWITFHLKTQIICHCYDFQKEMHRFIMQTDRHDVKCVDLIRNRQLTYIWNKISLKSLKFVPKASEFWASQKWLGYLETCSWVF